MSELNETLVVLTKVNAELREKITDTETELEDLLKDHFEVQERYRKLQAIKDTLREDAEKNAKFCRRKWEEEIEHSNSAWKRWAIGYIVAVVITQIVWWVL